MRIRTRQPAVAGTFYAADPGDLAGQLRAAFRDAVPPPADAPVPKAIVVPHAGYVYSGPIAASGYLRLVAGRSRIRRVVLLGPNHRVPLRGLASTGATTWRTPLGEVRIDTQTVEALDAAFPFVVVDDGPHVPEHSLEVQLPFLQTVLEDFVLVPLVVGLTTPDQVAAVLDTVWADPGTVVVVSTDLSHYHRYDVAVEIDGRTAAAIVAGRGGDIGPEQACGAYPLCGLLQVAASRATPIEQLDVRNSGDTAGDRGRVVGYGAFAIG